MHSTRHEAAVVCSRRCVALQANSLISLNVPKTTGFGSVDLHHRCLFAWPLANNMHMQCALSRTTAVWPKPAADDD